MEKTRLDLLIEHMEEDIESIFDQCSPKDKIALYLNAKEFQKAKMQRTSINPNDTELPKDIYPNETGAKSYEFIHTGTNFKDDSE